MAPLYCRLTPEQQNSMTSAHLHCPGSLGLLSGHLWRVSVQPLNLRCRIEHLRISTAELHINFAHVWSHFGARPCGGDRCKDVASTEGSGHGEPTQESPKAKSQPPLQWPFGTWPEAFQSLTSLKRVTIDFDAYPGEGVDGQVGGVGLPSLAHTAGA